MPVVVTDVTVQAQPNRSADLTAKKAGDLAMATVHLFVNNFNPTPTSVVGDFTEASYTGYSAQAVTGWNANELDALGGVSTDATNVMTFVGPASGPGATIYGYYVLSAGTGTPLLYSALFPTPVGLNSAADVLALVATFHNP